jgi:hypothetical protein
VGLLESLVRSISNELVAVILEAPAERESLKPKAEGGYLKSDQNAIAFHSNSLLFLPAHAPLFSLTHSQFNGYN